LHDGLIQDLAGLAIDIGRRAAKSQNTSASLTRQFRSLQTRTIRAAEIARKVAYELHPSEIDDLGLEAALRSYCEEFALRERVAVEYVCRNLPAGLPRDVIYGLYKVAQEGLRNVARHAAVAQATVTLQCHGQIVRLSVEDTGIGFDPGSLRLRFGMGILSMKERLKSLNGKFTIASEPGKGTHIEAEIPFKVLQ
jgi:signal transduction histidine kinase